MIVMKFGGTSVANFEAITRAIFIVGGRLDQKPVVVVSALSKVTDLLYRISDAAASRNVAETKELMSELRTRHVNLASDLLEQSPALKESAVSRVNAICDSLESLVNAVCAVGELSDRNKAIIISNGELLSSTIICFTMNAKGIRTNFVDARKMMITSNEYLKGEPVVDEIVARVPAVIDEAFKGMDAVITQGFIGTNMAGEQTVLGRGGSDYSASLIGMAVDANVIIFERVKEELKAGKSTGAAVNAGFNRAASAIIDGNVTIVTVALVLMGAFGSPDSLLAKLFSPIMSLFGTQITGSIYSFGYTLLVGTIFNLIMGVLASKYMLKSISQLKFLRKPCLYGGKKNG